MSFARLSVFSIASLVTLLATLLASGLLAVPAAASSLQEDTQPATKEYKNTIKWATASEVDNFGFDVFRGDSEDGPFEKLNDEAIEGGGTTDSPRRYQFVDDTVDPHAIYYYYVESIALDGTREQFTPIAKVGPKIKPEEAEDSDESEGR